MPTILRERSFTVTNERGDAVHGDLRYRTCEEASPVVIMCHGFKGFKDWGPFPTWGRALAEQGLASVLFNFSYNGVSPEEPTEFGQLDRFAQNTFTRELDDLQAVVDAVAGGALDGPLDGSRIGLLGHSRGGGTAILQAARDARVQALATWSSVAGFVDRFTPEQIDDWESRGYTEVVNGRTGQRMRLDRILYDDAMENRDRLDVHRAAREVDVPWLVVHARDDMAVSIEAAYTLADLGPEADLFEVQGGHTFGGAHPFDGEMPDALQAVWDRTAAFFTEALTEQHGAA